MRKHKILSMIAAFSLGVSLLSGCGTNASSGKGNQAQENIAGESTTGNIGSSGSDNDNETVSGADNMNVALGRYVESELTIPRELDGYNLAAFFRGRDGVIEMYANAPYGAAQRDKRTKRYIWDGAAWQKDEAFDKWLEEKSQTDIASEEISHITYGEDGNYYASVMDDKYIAHLYRLNEDGSVQELLSEVFLPPAGKSYGLIPSQIDVIENGDILIHSYSEVYGYRPDGARMFTISIFDSGLSDYSIGYVEGNDFVTCGENGHIVRYDVPTGGKTDDIVYDNMESAGHCQVLAGDGSKGIYMLNNAGMAHLNSGGSLWELLIDGSLNSISMNNIYLRSMIPGDDQDYYVAFGVNNGGIKICHYTYDPDMATVPPLTLTVYGLKDSITVSQAASVFQVHHPEVRVEVRSATSQNGDVADDTIRALNTELISGKGADVLILDGLPMESYVEKGVLMDMREVFAQIQQTAPILEGVCESFTGSDGSIYMMPVRVSVPLVLGGSDAVDAWKSMDAMAGYQGNHSLLWAENYENLLRLMAVLHYRELFDGESAIDRTALIHYLEAVKAIGEASGAKSAFTEEEKERLHASNKKIPPYGIRGTDIYYDMELADSALERITSMAGLAFPAAITDKRPGTVMDTVDSIYFPSILVGINRNTEMPDLAAEFIKCIFSAEIQKENFYDGLPVEMTSLERQRDEENDSYSLSMGYADYMISANWPDISYRKRLFDILVQASEPVIMDETLMGMVASNSLDYLEGKISADQAAAAIEQQVMLYRAEQG